MNHTLSMIDENNKYTNIFSTILVFVLIYFNSSSLAVTLRLSIELYSIFILVLFVSIYIFKVIKDDKIQLNKSLILISLILIIIILSNMVINLDYNIMNLVIISKIIIAYIVCNIFNYKQFVSSFINIVLFFCIYSLIITYIIAPFLPQVVNLFPTRINDAGLLVRDYIFGFHFEQAAPSRNTGIFREMGVFQYFINFALILELFTKEKTDIKYWRVAILIVTTLTTFSTAGLMQLGLIVIAFLFHLREKNKIYNLLKKSFLILFVLTLFLIIPNFNKHLNLSINKFNENASSYQGRTSAIEGNIKAWAESPVIGNGISKGYEISSFLGDFVHNTSTTTLFAAVYGIVFCLIVLFIMFYTINKLHTNILNKLLILVGILISMNSQSLIYDQLFYILIFTGFMKQEEYKNYIKG